MGQIRDEYYIKIIKDSVNHFVEKAELFEIKESEVIAVIRMMSNMIGIKPDVETIFNISKDILKELGFLERGGKKTRIKKLRKKK